MITSPPFIVIKADDEFKDKPTRPDQLWQSDFTSLKVIGWGGFYLSTVLDDFSRYIVAWKLRRHLAEKANQKVFARTPSARTIVRLITSARDDLTKPQGDIDRGNREKPTGCHCYLHDDSRLPANDSIESSR